MYRLMEIKIRNIKYFIIFTSKEFSRRKFMILLIYISLSQNILFV